MLDDCTLFNILDFAAEGRFFLAPVCKRWHKVLKKVNPGAFTTPHELLTEAQGKEVLEFCPDQLQDVLKWGIVNKKLAVIKYALARGAKYYDDYTSELYSCPVDLEIIGELMPLINETSQMSKVHSVLLQTALAREGDVEKLELAQCLLGFKYRLHFVASQAIGEEGIKSLPLLNWWYEKILQERDYEGENPLEDLCLDRPITSKTRRHDMVILFNWAVERDSTELVNWFIARGFTEDDVSVCSAVIGGNVDMLRRMHATRASLGEPHDLRLFLTNAFERGVEKWRALIDLYVEWGLLTEACSFYLCATGALPAAALDYLERLGVPRRPDESNAELMRECLSMRERREYETSSERILGILNWCTRDGLPRIEYENREIYRYAAEMRDPEILTWMLDRYPLNKYYLPRVEFMTTDTYNILQARGMHIRTAYWRELREECPRLYWKLLAHAQK